ncbi:DMT family transporter [Bacillus sp. CGMCC 1.16607]|uniref:DMT family transporter n=1 Tax=Bacillus sp. CGMCC 1.16607 TaxID=3351842 RepID=UPI003629887D
MKKSTFADLSLLFIAFIWGTTFVLVQNAISTMEPFAFNGFRFFIAFVILGTCLFLFQKNPLQYVNKKLIVSGVLLGFWLFLGYATQTLGLVYTTSSKAGFITGLSVVLVPLFSFLLLKQRPSFPAVIGVSVATIGLFLLTMTDVASLNIGDFFVFICALGFAMHIIFTGKFSGQFPTLLLTTIQILTVSILSIISSIIFEDFQSMFHKTVIFSPAVIAALLITSVFATAIAFFAQTRFQKNTTPTRVALIFAMEPVFAALTAYFWANERLSISAVFGCLFIFLGMVFAELPADRFLLYRNKTVKKMN